MSTVSTLDVNGPANEVLWVTVSDLARQRGIDKSAVSRRVARFEADGLIEARSGPRGSKLINVAAFDRLVGETGDAFRSQAPAVPGRLSSSLPVSDANNPILAQEQAKRVAYQAELARLDLEERLGKLLPVADVVEAMTRCAEAMVRAIDQLPGRADDVAAAVAKDGAAGARAYMRTMARDLRDVLARELRLLEAESPAAPNVGDPEQDIDGPAP